MSTNIDKLRDLALGATGGVWRVESYVDMDGVRRTMLIPFSLELPTGMEESDMAYIAAANPATVLVLLEALEALEGLTGDIQDLIGESSGVAGLHMNGDVAPWGDLEAGGRFERLTHLPAAHAAITKVKGGAA